MSETPAAESPFSLGFWFIYERSRHGPEEGRTMDIGLLLLRLVVGTTLAAHGAQKLLCWFGGPGLAGAAAGFEGLGFTPGRRHALMASVVEIGGGLLLAGGLAAPLPTGTRAA